MLRIPEKESEEDIQIIEYMDGIEKVDSWRVYYCKI